MVTEVLVRLVLRLYRKTGEARYEDWLCQLFKEERS